MKPYFILLSGGSGIRMKAALPKQFLELARKPVILHSAEVFCNWKKHAGFICVANQEYIKETEIALDSIRIKLEKENNIFRVVSGGENRHASTLSGIQAVIENIKDEDLMFFHDAARPLLLEYELELLFEVFYKNPSIEIASLVSYVTETLVMGNSLPGLMTKSLNRNQIFTVKTPQVIKVSSLKKLTKSSPSMEFTDLLTWGEASGIMGSLVEADDDNIKLTKISDLEIMNAVLMKRKRNG
jgi:2-C-methyl-D-erythritol 4-phosphate cytidylyltransferase